MTFVVGENCIKCKHTDCVDACPRDAWILNDAELALDTDACDGCGLCRPACPQQAITHDYRLELRSFRDRKVALVACERALSLLHI